MKNLSLLPSKNGFYFGDPGKKIVTDEIFYCKKRGIAILMRMLVDKEIRAENAMALLNQVMELETFPIAIRLPGRDPLDQDILELEIIKNFRHMIKIFEKLDCYKEPTLVLCPGCGKHAQIVGPKAISPPFYSKEEGLAILELMKGDEVISYADYLRLEGELKKLDLPESKPDPQKN